MATVTVVPNTGTAVSLVSVPRIHRGPLYAPILFLLSDALAITATGAFALFLAPGNLDPHHYVTLGPAAAAVLFACACFGLYPGIVHNAVDELRRLALALTAAFVAITGLLLLNRTLPWSWLPLLWWTAAMAVTPCLRAQLREVVSRRPGWGVPVAVFHTGEASADIVRELQTHPEIGLRPVVLLVDQPPQPRPDLPMLDRGLAPAVRASGVERALLMLSDAGAAPLLEDLEKFESVFPRLMIFHHAGTLYNLTVDARQLCGRLAVEVRRDLLLPLPRLAKRALDLLIVAFGLPMVTLIILLLGLLVRLESPGPVFFAHRRVGRQRTIFRTWKLRTMQTNGDEVLKEALAQNDALRAEWTCARKLRHDPRVTRVGRFLRKTSLDELPQFWNVLRGEMSLVGPRPIVEEEIPGYGPSFALYCRVTPGLTGLWQVSGRSDVSIGDRVRLDSYYVRNWSPWLDLLILARTAKVVFTGQGAY